MEEGLAFGKKLLEATTAINLIILALGGLQRMQEALIRSVVSKRSPRGVSFLGNALLWLMLKL